MPTYRELLQQARAEISEVDAAQARDLVEGGDAIVVDVREQDEWDAVHIPGSIHIPYHDIHAIPDELDPARPVAVICASGRRSVVAASLLQRFGRKDVIHVVEGGVGTWARKGYEAEGAA